MVVYEFSHDGVVSVRHLVWTSARSARAFLELDHEIEIAAVWGSRHCLAKIAEDVEAELFEDCFLLQGGGTADATCDIGGNLRKGAGELRTCRMTRGSGLGVVLRGCDTLTRQVRDGASDGGMRGDRMNLRVAPARGWAIITTKDREL